MLQLDEVSADLCTFSTPFGRYQFLRLPYGISCAPELFHSRVRQHLEDLEGVDSFIDDIVVWGRTREEHDVRLKRLLERARDIGMRFNKDKCKFGVKEITYLGHIFDERGMRPDVNKVKAILEMPEPKDRKSLERFLGMINYLSKFVPNYSQSVAVLRHLLKKNAEWVWDSVHSEAVKLLKNKIATAPVLALYSGELPVVLSVDASSEALGAVLLQGGRPVEFASLTLTDTQRRYAQIEKEMLAIVFASALRGDMLQRIHEGHLGIDRCKRRARQVMFWVGMSRDIERAVRECATCERYAPAPRREPMLPHDIPDVPWFKLGSDIFEYRKKYFLILVDYFSNFVEVTELNSINSKSIIKAMKEQFARHGIPNELLTDNFSAYVSSEFQAFLRAWDIKHVTSSPLYAQSNGKSERSVRTVKNLLKKCCDSGEDYYIGLLNLRTTPRENIDSPAQILMGRRLNTRLPTYHKLFDETVDRKRNYSAILKHQQKQKVYYDRSAKTLPPLHTNDKVVIVDGKERKLAKVVQQSAEPRSYVVEDQTRHTDLMSAGSAGAPSKDAVPPQDFALPRRTRRACRLYDKNNSE
ncbi:uncharacterized protein K02A2.6-like [Maniola jurtina]|uniref:uncharacterized protein K02A2.6-like n=1 Tax=Maniola jurtina TaxID=191418 RepID=UPI001E68D129|nr:uncharacterized protein K02A2.6-like [Maniola jurtina]